MNNKKVKDEVVRECYKCKSIITLNIKENNPVGKFLCDKCFMKELKIKYNKTYESLKLMLERYENKCKENDELKRHCEQLAYMAFKRQCVIDELVGIGDE